MASLSAQSSPLVVLAATASKLLGRAVGACLASAAAPGELTVVLELQQSPQAPGLLGLRVCDDGMPLAAEERPLERWAAGLGPLLARPLFADSMLLAQATGMEEAAVRRYRFQAAAGGCVVRVLPASNSAKPPGSTLRGSVLELTILLQQQPGQQQGADVDASGCISASHYVRQVLAEVGGGQGGTSVQQQQQQLPASAEEVVACLQRLMGMLRVLAPPVRLLMRLNGVQLQAPDGSLQPVSGSRRMDLELEPSLGALAWFSKGMSSEFLPQRPQAMTGTAGSAGGQFLLDAVARGASIEENGAEEGTSTCQIEQPQQGGDGQKPVGGAAEAATPRPAPAAVAAQGQHPLLLTFLGMGEAGWGCPGAAQQFRGCKWTARAGLVLQLPDHEALQAAAAGQAGKPGDSNSEGKGGRENHVGGAGGDGAPTPVYLFRSWEMLLGVAQQEHVLKGLQKCEWGNYGFSLEMARSSTDGPLEAVLLCAQPQSGARITEGVVTLTPCEYRSQAEGGQPPPLASSHEGRLVRQALEAALQHLKQQCPAVISSRRERSLARALQPLSKALAGILVRSAEGHAAGALEDKGSALHQACSMVGCHPEELEGGITGLLQEVTVAALAGDEAGEGGSKRLRQQGHQDQDGTTAGSQA